MRIGQEVEFKNDFKIETYLTGTKLQVKSGDKALVTNMGLKILTGEARGKITNFADNTELKGYDYENISKLIYRRLDNYFDLGELLENDDIDSSRFREEIEEVLMNIL